MMVTNAFPKLAEYASERIEVFAMVENTDR